MDSQNIEVAPRDAFKKHSNKNYYSVIKIQAAMRSYLASRQVDKVFRERHKRERP